MIEELVVTGDWWDYVDAITARSSVQLAFAHPHQSSCVVSAARSGARAETMTSAFFAMPE